MGLLSGIADALGIGDSDGPQADPNVGLAMRENAALAREMAGVSREELAFNRERAAKLDPKYMEALDTQNEISKKNQAMSDEQWKRYQDLYAPVEDRMVSDANKWDSPEDVARVQQQAIADTSRAYGVARGTSERNQARVGINPASGRSRTEELGLEIAQAASGADASNQAAERRRLEGMSMRENVAKFGRNMPATGLAADQAALAGASSAVGTTNAALMARPNAVNASLPWMTNAVGANTSAGQLGIGQYGVDVSKYGKQLDTLGDALGAGAAAAGAIFSSKDYKEDKAPVNDDMVLEGIETLPVEAWRYKKGMGLDDGARHMGPYAEDMNERFGDDVAPGGEMIDVASMNGIALSGIKALAKKVKKMEKELGLDNGYKRGMRDTEPRRVA